MEKEFDTRIEFIIEKELFDFENEFDIENETITNLQEMNVPSGLPQQRPYVPLKSDTWEFSNSPPFKTSECFYATITGDFECFTLTLKQVF